MKYLQLIKPGLYRDSNDGRIVGLISIMKGGQRMACIHKFITPDECLRPSIRDDTDYQPTAKKPLNFVMEAKQHSCQGIYWHVHIPAITDGSRIRKGVKITPESIDGMVSSAKIREGVRLDPIAKRILEQTIDLASEGVTAEQYVWDEKPFCEDLYTTQMRGPFTIEYRDVISGGLIYTRTKSCGYIHGDETKNLMIKIVQDQFAEKVADIKRIYGDLVQVDLRDVPDSEESRRLRESIASLEVLHFMVRSLNEVLDQMGEFNIK